MNRATSTARSFPGSHHLSGNPLRAAASPTQDLPLSIVGKPLGPTTLSDRSLQGRARRTPARGLKILKWVVIGAALAFFVLPIFYMVLMSFKSPDDILSRSILPTQLVWQNWSEALGQTPILTNLRNSLIVATGATALSLVIAIPANYAMARLRIGGKRTMTLVVSAYIAPPVVAIVPLFLLVRSIGLMDSLTGLIIVQALVISPVVVWLLDTFFRAVPPEVDEAAQIDGCGPITTLFRIILPLVAPGIVAVAIIAFILTYNDFLIPLMLAQSVNTQTLPVGIALLQGGREVMFGQMAAASLSGMTPVYVLALVMQKWLIGGLTQGSVK
jgi:multiple sugar transport system permease protein